MVALLRWWGMLEIFALIGLPLVAWAFPRLKDSGFSLARLVGLLLVAYPVWLLSHLGPFFGNAMIVLWLLAWGGVSVAIVWADLPAWKARLSRSQEILLSEVVWLCAFFLLALLRAYSPDIVGMSHWGGCEKFMDLNFVNSILNSTTFPPNDNWMQGFPINYYYYGYYLCAVLIKLTGVLPHVGYNLMLVTVYALAIHGMWGLLRNLGVKWYWALLGLFLAFFASNLKTAANAWESDTGRILPHQAMSTSRVIDLPNDHTINEYPIFSFLWGDLHGHLFGMAFQMSILGLCWGAIVAYADTSRSAFRSAFGVFLLAIAFGSMVVTNAWDLPAFGAVILFSLLSVACLRRDGWALLYSVGILAVGGAVLAAGMKMGVPLGILSLVLLAAGGILAGNSNRLPQLRLGSGILLRLALLVAVMGILFAPFFETFVPPTSGHNRIPAEVKSPLNLFLKIFGPHLALLTIPLLAFLVRLAFNSQGEPRLDEARQKKENLIRIGMVLMGLLVVVTAGFVMKHDMGSFAIAATPWLLFSFLVLAGFWLFDEWLRCPEEGEAIETARSGRFVAFLLILGIGLALGCEFVAVKDFYGNSSLRFNTVFKFHLQAWLLLAVCAAYASHRLFDGIFVALKNSPPLRWALPLPILMQVALVSAVVAATGYGSQAFIRVMCHDFSIEPTQDGLAHAFANPPRGDIAPNDARLLLRLLDEQRFNWEEERLIAEVPGDPYSAHGRVSTFTGIPTLMGWTNHEGIWNKGKPEAMTRKDQANKAGQEIYALPSFAKTKALLEEHKVTHVFFGHLERREFGNTSLRKFRKYMKVAQDRNGKPLESGESVVFAGYQDVSIEDSELVEKPAKPLPLATIVAEPEHPLLEPRGIDLGSADTLFVCSSKGGSIEHYSAEGKWLASFGREEGAGKLSADYSGVGGIRLASDGTIWVTDTWNHRLVLFSQEGGFLREIRSDFFGPRDVIFFGGMTVVADTGHQRLAILTPEGIVVRTLGQKGSAAGQFIEPVGLATDGEQLFVADTGNSRIQVFDTQFRWIRSFDVLGWSDPVWTEPYLALDVSGKLWLTDAGNNRIQCYSSDGNLLAVYGPQCTPAGTLKNVKGISIQGDRMALSDTGNNRVLVLPVPAAE